MAFETDEKDRSSGEEIAEKSSKEPPCIHILTGRPFHQFHAWEEDICQLVAKKGKI